MNSPLAEASTGQRYLTLAYEHRMPMASTPIPRHKLNLFNGITLFQAVMERV